MVAGNISQVARFAHVATRWHRPGNPNPGRRQSRVVGAEENAQGGGTMARVKKPEIVSADSESEKRWITVGGAARLLRISEYRVRRLVEDGTLRAARMSKGGWRLVDSKSVTLLQSRLSNDAI